MTFTHALATNNYGTAKFIVSASAANGTHTTIQAAITAATSGDTVFIRDGSYTENLTLKAGVNLTAFGGSSETPNVTIIGNATLSAAGTVSISNIRLQTNSAAFLTVSGSAASVVNLLGCYLNCTNATGISFSSSSSSAIIEILNCNGDIGTTGISLFTSTSAGPIRMRYVRITNTGNSVTASTASAGGISINSCVLSMVLSSSSTGGIDVQYSQLASSDTTTITFNGTGGSQIENSIINSGTASTISIGSGVTASIHNCRFTSTNTNVITGAGTLVGANIVMASTGKAVNPTSISNDSIYAGGWVLIDTKTASTSASVQFTTGITTKFTRYAFVFSNVTLATNQAGLLIQLSTNGGSSYLNTGYISSVFGGSGAAGTAGSTSTAGYLLSLSGANGYPSNASFGQGSGIIYDLTTGGTPQMTAHTCHPNTGAANTLITNGCVANGPSATTANALQFIATSGNITTGTFSLYGISS